MPLEESAMDNHSNKRYLLAIDNGTQSVRALLFDLQGNLLGKGKVNYRRITRRNRVGPSRTRNITGRNSARPASRCGRKPGLIVRRSPVFR